MCSLWFLYGCHNTGQCEQSHIVITHPFMVFCGKKYLVVGQYHHGGTLYLRCVDEPNGQVLTFPSSITDYPAESNQANLDVGAKTYFTIQGLMDAAFILDSAPDLST